MHCEINDKKLLSGTGNERAYSVMALEPPYSLINELN